MNRTEALLGNHFFQNANGVDDRDDCHPWGIAFQAGGEVIAVFVDCGFVLAATDQVPPVLPSASGSGSGQQPVVNPSTSLGRMPVR